MSTSKEKQLARENLVARLTRYHEQVLLGFRHLSRWEEAKLIHAAIVALAPLAGPVDASRQPQLEHFWTSVARGWDIEPRAYFEKEAIEMGYKSPIEMAVHHMWKRHAKDWPNEELRAAAAVPSSPAQERLLTRAREALASTRYEFDSDCKIAMQIVKEIDTATSLAQLKAFRPTTDQPTDADIEPALPPSSPVAPTWFCKGCPETFTSSNVAAEHSRATYHVITSNPLERVFVTESEVGPDSAVRRIAAMAMTAQSDPHASALVYRQALVDICNFALASAPSPSAGAKEPKK